MASSSHHNLKGSLDETFDESFDQHFDQTFGNLCNVYGDQEDERKTGEKEFSSKEIVKKAISGYGMIISVTLQHIQKIYSDDDLE